MKTESSTHQPSEEERVHFENWRELGCQVIVAGKEVLTLATPESSLGTGGGPAFVEDWVTPEEFCDNLTAVLRAFVASTAVLEQVEWERQNYLESQVPGPSRRTDDLLREVEQMAAALKN